jgi:hypothetical protein
MSPCVVPVVVSDPSTDQTSQYFVCPNDGPSSVKATSLLTSSNYHSWSRSTRRALGGKLKLKFVHGNILVHADLFNSSVKAWNHCNSLVHSWILNSVSEYIAQSLVFMENIMDVWNYLKERFSQADRTHCKASTRDLCSQTRFTHCHKVLLRSEASLGRVRDLSSYS